MALSPLSAGDLPSSCNRKNGHRQIGIFPAPIFSCLLSQGRGDQLPAGPALCFEVYPHPPHQAPGFTGFLLFLLYFPSVPLYQSHPTGSQTSLPKLLLPNCTCTAFSLPDLVTPSGLCFPDVVPASDMVPLSAFWKRSSSILLHPGHALKVSFVESPSSTPPSHQDLVLDPLFTLNETFHHVHSSDFQSPPF